MNPKAENFFKVADVLRPYALWTEDNQLDMNEAIVQGGKNSCYTVHCVGGWYYLARAHIIYEKQFIGFSQGANWMAQDLGFTCMVSLAQWCEDNPKLWGNSHGAVLFGSISAWNNAKNLMGVVNHLIAVGNRLERQTLIYGKGAPEPKRTSDTLVSPLRAAVYD